MLYVAGSTSTKTGFAPHQLIASAVAMKVSGTVITSSPGPIPSPSRATQRASVPLPTPAANCVPQNAANSFSNWATNGPPAKAVLSSTCWIASAISARIGSYCAFRSR